MSFSLLNVYVAGLFGKHERSDCAVRFYTAGSSGPTSHDDAAWLHEPLPAHTLVIAACSERLAAQLDSPWWPRSSDSAAQACTSRKRKKLAKEPDVEDGSGPSSSAPPGSRERPLLAVPLDDAGELEPATAVIRFMYTECLQPGASVYDLLLTLKLSQYLLCTPCGEACAKALAEAETVSYDDVLRVYGSTSLVSILEDGRFKPFADKCAEALASKLGDTLAVMRRQVLLGALSTCTSARTRAARMQDGHNVTSIGKKARKPPNCCQTVRNDDACSMCASCRWLRGMRQAQRVAIQVS